MSNKLNTKKFIEKAKIIHGDKYDYLKVNYIRSTIKIVITCPKHGDFIQEPNNHINGKHGCPKCDNKNKLSTEDFIKKAKEVHGDKYDYSKVDYKTNKTKVIIVCPEHGEFLQRPNDHISKKNGCPKCSGLNRSSIKEFIKKAKEVHDNKYDYSKVNYINNNTKVIIICPEHGEFEQTPDGHINRKNGCPKCSGLNKLSTEDFIKKAKEVHGDKYDYSKVDYISTHIKVIIVCPKHGEFLQRPNKHLIRRDGCLKCANEQSESKDLSFLKGILMKNNIYFKEECTFKGLKYKNPLRIDLVIPKYNLYIEYDGVQHFKNSYIDNIVKETHIRDCFKNSWALKHEINFLRIPYTFSRNNLKKLIKIIIKDKELLLNFVIKNNLYFIPEDSDKIYNDENYYKNYIGNIT